MGLKPINGRDRKVLTLFLVLAGGLFLLWFILPSSTSGSCGKAKSQADSAANTAKSQLESLKIVSGQTVQAEAQTYGDCIDSNSYYGQATAVFNVNDSAENLQRDVCHNICPQGYISDNKLEPRSAGSNSDIGLFITKYHNTNNDELTVEYTLQQRHECSQPGAFRACDATDQAEALQQPVYRVNATLRVANSEFTH